MFRLFSPSRGARAHVQMRVSNAWVTQNRENQSNAFLLSGTNIKERLFAEMDSSLNVFDKCKRQLQKQLSLFMWFSCFCHTGDEVEVEMDVWCKWYLLSSFSGWQLVQHKRDRAFQELLTVLGPDSSVTRTGGGVFCVIISSELKFSQWNAPLCTFYCLLKGKGTGLFTRKCVSVSAIEGV